LDTIQMLVAKSTRSCEGNFDCFHLSNPLSKKQI
jgi:hypothetical protein